MISINKMNEICFHYQIERPSCKNRKFYNQVLWWSYHGILLVYPKINCILLRYVLQSYYSCCFASTIAAVITAASSPCTDCDALELSSGLYVLEFIVTLICYPKIF